MKPVHRESKSETGGCPDSVIMNEVKLLLAEKRTTLAAMRTGIAVFALPVSALSVLIATSRYYNVLEVINLIIPLLVLCACLVLLGSYLIIRSIRRIRHYDNLVLKLKRKHSRIAEFID
jgi:uncharacterized membrane protein YdbT with pleckstrin-like domain